MGVVLFGHGRLDTGTGPCRPKMEWVGVPQGTTIQFYADTGQLLKTGEDGLRKWGDLGAPWGAIDHTGVAPNYALMYGPEFDYLLNHPSFAGHTVVRAGNDGLTDPIFLCDGDPGGPCPQNPKDITAGKIHRCNGLLAKYSGDLYWLACSDVRNDAGVTPPEVIAAMGDSRSRVGLADAAVTPGAGEVAYPDDAAYLMDTIPGTSSTVGAALNSLRTYPNEFGAWFDALSPDGRRVVTYHPEITAWSQTHPCGVCAKDKEPCSLQMGHLGAHTHATRCWGASPDNWLPGAATDGQCDVVCTTNGHNERCESDHQGVDHWHWRTHTW